MASPFTGIAAAIDALVELGISEGLAIEIRSFLEDSASDLTDHKPKPVSHGAYGRAPGSLQLASDASKARAHVVEALRDMASGLEGYGDIVHQLYLKTAETDDAAEADFIAQTKKADSMIPVSFAAAHPGDHSHGRGPSAGGK